MSAEQWQCILGRRGRDPRASAARPLPKLALKLTKKAGRAAKRGDTYPAGHGAGEDKAITRGRLGFMKAMIVSDPPRAHHVFTASSAGLGFSDRWPQPSPSSTGIFTGACYVCIRPGRRKPMGLTGICTHPEGSPAKPMTPMQSRFPAQPRDTFGSLKPARPVRASRCRRPPSRLDTATRGAESRFARLAGQQAPPLE